MFLAFFVILLYCFSFFIIFSLSFFLIHAICLTPPHLLHRVGNTGTPGVWLFHTGNYNSFDNIVPAAVGGLLATPSPRGQGFSLVPAPTTLHPTHTHTPADVSAYQCIHKKEKKADSSLLAPRTRPPLSTPSSRSTRTTRCTPMARTRRKRRRRTTTL